MVKLRILLISLVAFNTNAFDADAVPGVTPSKTPNSSVVIVVLSNVIEVSAVIVPEADKSPLHVIAPQLIVPKPETFPFVSNLAVPLVNTPSIVKSRLKLV